MTQQCRHSSIEMICLSLRQVSTTTAASTPAKADMAEIVFVAEELALPFLQDPLGAARHRAAAVGCLPIELTMLPVR